MATATEAVSPAELVRKLARQEAQAFTEWQESDEEHPPTAYYTAVENLLQNYNPTAVPVARDSMQRLSDAYRNYLHDTTRQTPNNEFWAARSMAFNDLFRQPPPPLKRPSPAEMHAAKVGPIQIAHEWMIYKEDGTPDIERVHQELAEPGSVVDEQYIAWRHQQDLIRLGFVIPETDAEKIAEAYKPPVKARRDPHVSIEDMIRSRMPFDQIFGIMKTRYQLDDTNDSALRNLITAFGDMMNVPLINVRQILNDAGHETAEQIMGEMIANADLPPVYVMDSTPQPFVDNPEGERKTIGKLYLPGQEEQAVLQRFTEGYSVREIAKESGLSQAKVKEIIQKAQQSS